MCLGKRAARTSNLEFSSWNGMSAGLTPEERKEALALFYSRVEMVPGTEVK